MIDDLLINTINRTKNGEKKQIAVENLVETSVSQADYFINHTVWVESVGRSMPFSGSLSYSGALILLSIVWQWPIKLFYLNQWMFRNFHSKFWPKPERMEWNEWERTNWKTTTGALQQLKSSREKEKERNKANKTNGKKCVIYTLIVVLDAGVVVVVILLIVCFIVRFVCIHTRWLLFSVYKWWRLNFKWCAVFVQTQPSHTCTRCFSCTRTTLVFLCFSQNWDCVCVCDFDSIERKLRPRKKSNNTNCLGMITVIEVLSLVFCQSIVWPVR